MPLQTTYGPMSQKLFHHCHGVMLCCIYMVPTPSPYTKEAIKVASYASVDHELIDKLYVGMEGNA